MATNSSAIAAGEDAKGMVLEDVALFSFVYNRFELMRTSLLTILAYREGIRRVQVIDDGSADWRVRRWLEGLAALGHLAYHRRESNGGPGLCRQLSARLCPAWATCAVWIDSDIVVGPGAFTTMRRIADCWWTSDRPIGMLCALATRRPRREPPVGEDAVLDGWGDLGLVLIRGSLLRDFGEEILDARRDEASEFTKALKRAGYRRSAVIGPPIPCAHLGIRDSTVPPVARNAARRPWGAGSYRNPLEGLLNYESFFTDYPDSARRLGDQIRDTLLPVAMGEQVRRVDESLAF